MQPNQDPRQLTALYQACLDDAARQGGLMIETLLDYVRYNLRQREAELRNFDERNAVSESLRWLGEQQAAMVAAFPKALCAGFAAPSTAAPAAVPSLNSLRFDQLELMDEVQVQARVEMARAQQMTAHTVEASLSELNTLVCALQDLPSVQPDRNPFRPEVYLRALQDVVMKTGASAAVRQVWMLHMCAILGKELDVFYRRMVSQLREKGVKPVGYQVAGQAEAFVMGRPRYRPEVLAPVAQTAERVVDEAPRATQPLPALYLDDSASAPGTGAGKAVLTVSNLRNLLVQDGAAGVPSAVGAVSRREEFEARFAREFEQVSREEDPPHTDFQSTLPAAFDALDDPAQVDQILLRLAQVPQTDERARREHLRQRLRQDASGTQQAVAREVVGLMIEKLANDERLLPSVRQAVRSFAPALIRLVAVDPRFFSDRKHPARQLLDEITERSLAWDNEAAPGCAAFLAPVNEVARLLAHESIGDAEPFSVALAELRRAWHENQQNEARQREQAVQALLRAEQRNLLADKLRMELGSLPETEGVAGEVLAFLLGPWAQVLAQARLTDASGDADPGGYRGLVEVLLWSAKPELASQNPGRLTRTIPSLLAKLREGLKTIDYPLVQISAFLERLMLLHQAAYRRPAPVPVPTPSVGVPPEVPKSSPPEASPAVVAAPVAAKPAPEADEAWLAPKEVSASGFMSLGAGAKEGVGETPPVAENPPSMPLELGAWVELMTDGVWLRTQLTWASPHGTLLLFTQADGRSRSMTRRMRDRLIANGHLRVVSAQPVVVGALDAVAQAALRNSVDADLPKPSH